MFQACKLRIVVAQKSFIGLGQEQSRLCLFALNLILRIFSFLGFCNKSYTSGGDNGEEIRMPKHNEHSVFTVTMS